MIWVIVTITKETANIISGTASELSLDMTYKTIHSLQKKNLIFQLDAVSILGTYMVPIAIDLNTSQSFNYRQNIPVR